MKKLLIAFRKPDMWPFRRFAAIALCACLLDSAYVLLASHPLPGAALIPAMIPLFVCVFIVIPMSRARKS